MKIRTNIGMLELDVVEFINPDIAEGREFINNGVEKHEFPNPLLDFPVNIVRFENCKYMGFYLTGEIILNNGKILGVGVSIIGQILRDSNELIVKLVVILDKPLIRADLKISSRGNRNIRYLN